MPVLVYYLTCQITNAVIQDGIPRNPLKSSSVTPLSPGHDTAEDDLKYVSAQ